MATSDRLTELKEMSMNRIDWVTRNSKSVVWLDFPDYSNVGDSAIWLGQMAWAKSREIRVTATLSQRAFSKQLLDRIVGDSDAVPVINGGGNFGDIWKNHQQHRERVLEWRGDGPLAQAPQSVWFRENEAGKQMLEMLGKAKGLRALVRDEASFNWIKQGCDASLSPDAAHAMGTFEAPEPVTQYVVLARTDQERSPAAGKPVASSIDWISEADGKRRARQVLGSIAGVAGRPEILKLIPYEKAAHTRLARGVESISIGKVLVTDRLHGMLLGLMMGRHVIAVDNDVQKLSRYASAWLKGCEDKLTFAPTIDEAVSEAKRK